MKSSYGAKTIIGAWCFLLISGPLFASTLRISWNNNTEWDLAGYRVYYGTVSGAYGHVLDVGDCACVEIDGIEEDTVYFFSVTAYDVAGNESDYSREISVLVHEDVLGRLLAAVNGFLDIIGTGGDADTGAPRYVLDEFYETGGTIPVAASSTVLIENSDVVPAGEFTQGAYLIKDVIVDGGEVLDLATVYPAGTYTFVALTDRICVIAGGVIQPDEPGAYLFLVQDVTGGLVDILRVSVVNRLCQAMEYLPGTGMMVDGGISVFLPEDALGVAVPMGIDCGGANSAALSALSVNGPSSIVFDIVPYGLVLAYPALISVLFDDPGPVEVEVFDEAARKWTRLDDVDMEDGVVTFSTTMLGTFKVSAVAQASDEGAAGSSGGGGGCFIESLQAAQAATHRGCTCLLFAMIVLIAARYSTSVRKRS